jgi:hypothetical protein
VFAAAILIAAAISPQEKVAVLPPQGGRNVLEINKKTVRSAFLEYISEPGSGFAALDRHSIDMMIQREPSVQPNMLYNEKTAMDIGKKLGVPLVCIIDLTRDERDFLIECKLVRVDTGRAVSKSEIVSGLTNAEIKKASEALIRKLMTGGGAIIAAGAPAVSAAVHTELPSSAAATIASTPSQVAAARAEPPSKAATPSGDGNDNANKKVNEPKSSLKPEVPKVAPDATVARVRWDYKVVAAKGNQVEDVLTKAGDEGWILAAMDINSNGFTFNYNMIFKRQKK